MAQHTIVINVDKNRQFSSKKHLALPSLQFVVEGDQVEFFAKNSNIEIFFPKAGDLFLNFPSGNALPLQKNKKSSQFTVKNISDPRPVIFPYAVYCEDDNDFAEGNSSPKIIVD